MIARNLHQAIPQFAGLLHSKGTPIDNGDTIILKIPACMEITKPFERFVYWPQIRVNPFREFVIGLCIMGGKWDLLNFFGFNYNKDVPEEITYPLIKKMSDDEVSITNCIHAPHVADTSFISASMFLEYIAKEMSMKPSASWLVYLALWASSEDKELLKAFGGVSAATIAEKDPYMKGMVSHFPMFDDQTSFEDFQTDLKEALDLNLSMGYKTRYFRRVVIPTLSAYKKYIDAEEGEKKFKDALDNLAPVEATDLRFACDQWIVQQMGKWEQKRQDSLKED